MVRDAKEASNPHRAHATTILSGETMISDTIHGTLTCEQRRWKENKNVLNMLNEGQQSMGVQIIVLATKKFQVCYLMFPMKTRARDKYFKSTM